jgi:primosomal protein N' (replication factor Y)
VVVQTFNPDHAAIKAAVRHDYQTFAVQELANRESLAYPPFASMLRLVVRGEKEAATREFADALGEQLTAALERHEAAARVLGPAPAPIAKLRGRYRFQLQVQSRHGDRLRAAAAEVAAEIKTPAEVQWIVDVDPLDML